MSDYVCTRKILLCFSHRVFCYIIMTPFMAYAAEIIATYVSIATAM